MSASGRRFLLRVGIVCGAVAVLAAGVHQLGYRVNETASLPIGVWRIAPPAHLAKGVIVNFCPPATPLLVEARQRGYLTGGRCAAEGGGLESMFKPIVALAGDHVETSAAGVVVNGSLIANSAISVADGAGRAMPVAPPSSVVPAGKAWVVSSYSPYSFDSRYFGPIALDSVLGVATPVFLWGEP